MEGVSEHLSFAEDSLGYFPINIDAFILQDMKLLEISITFLQLIFNLIMLLLSSISVLLVYSLLMFSVESKSFDLGVMRMLGLSKNNVIVLIIVQSFMFVVPSIICGVSFSLILLRVAKHFAENTLHIDFEAVPSIGSFIQALTLSTLIPLVSSIMPIQIVLQRNLNDALDIQRSKTQATFVNIVNKKQANYLPMVLFGAAITLYGVTIYYTLPLALMSMNLSLVSQVIIFILVGLLFALVLLAFNIQPMMERFLSKVFLCFEIKSMRLMAVKNLSAHRNRNQMTALIYSLALGFLMFLSISCRMQIEVSTAEKLKIHASYFNVKTLDKHYFDIFKTEQVLKHHSDLIEEFSWVTAKMHEFEGTQVSTTYFNDMVAYPHQTVEVHGLQPNYFKTAISDYTVEHHSKLDADKGWLVNSIGHP